MKKVLVLLLVTLFCFGCSEQPTNEEQDSKPNTTKKTVTIAEQLVYEDNVMTIIAKESTIDLNQDEMFINFEITNHSNKAIVVYSESMMLNNVSVNGQLWAEVAPNSTQQCFSEYYQSRNPEMDLESIASITYRLYLSKMGKNDYETYKTTDFLTITTDDPNYVYQFEAKGTLEMDVDGYKIWSLGTFEDEEEAYVKLCFANETDTNVRMQISKVIVNGYIPKKTYGYVALPPHSYCFDVTRASLEDLAKVNSTSIKSVTLEVQVMRQGDDKRMIEKQTVLIETEK
ncbi:MAG: hypothetical protein IJO78_03005 [Erysipelotrichaceae bacterium]|nr:hypothetical protein [Erysipelotrichaceae bacterium]